MSKENLEKFVELFPVIEEIADLYVKKSQDYNKGKPQVLDEYFPFGQTSYSQMIWVKAMRLRSLSEQEDEPNFESIEDTLKDLINYCLFNLRALEK